MKHITNHKHLALAVAMAAVLALAGCGSAVETDNTVTETEAVVESTEDMSSTEATEAFVPETELETESTEDETVEPESTEVSETETTVIESEASPKAETPGYTFTDMNTTMYAKNSVNVRSLPSTDGTRVGSLSTNQEVTVTGQCNETGWYRIQYNNSKCYVSNKYLTEQKVATTSPKTESTNTAGAGVDTAANTDSYIALMEAVIAQFGPNIIVYDNQTICDSTTGQQIGTISNGQIVATNDSQTYVTASATMTNGFDRAAAESIWSYMNAERTAAGLNEIAWDENIYNFACQRAQAIVNDFSHNGSNGYSENILMNYTNDPYTLHMQWHNSSGHYNNYMSGNHTKGACAVYLYNGNAYAVENFTCENSAVRTTREVNGQTVDVTQAEAAAIDAGNTWTASNGVVIRILDNGNLTAGDGVHSLEELQAAMNEYYATH